MSLTKKSLQLDSQNAITLLRADHQRVADLFETFEKSRSTAKKKVIAQEICNELTVHATIEEEIFYPELKTHPSARVLNVASLAACGPLPFKTVYPASKAFVLHWSRALRAELRGTNVRVGVLLPGPMRTNVDVRGRMDKQGWIGRRTAISPEAAARVAVRGLVKGRAVIVPGAAAKLNRFLMGAVPTPILLFFTGRVFSREAN